MSQKEHFGNCRSTKIPMQKTDTIFLYIFFLCKLEPFDWDLDEGNHNRSYEKKLSVSNDKNQLIAVFEKSNYQHLDAWQKIDDFSNGHFSKHETFRLRR